MKSNIKLVRFSTAFKNLMLKYFLILGMVFFHILIRVVALVPTYYWYTHRHYPNPWWACLITLALFVFVILPLRYSFAGSLIEIANSKTVSFKAAFSFKLYAEKLNQGLTWLLHLVIWIIPLFLGLGLGAYFYLGGLDALTLGRFIANTGRTLFGDSASIYEGGLFYAGIYVALILVFAFGVMRNSTHRYLSMSDIRLSVKPQAEIRRCLNNRRGKQLIIGLINLVLLLPVIWFAFSGLFNQYNMEKDLLMFLPKLKSMSFYTPILWPVAVFYILVLPVRRARNASFALDCMRLRSINGKN